MAKLDSGSHKSYAFMVLESFKVKKTLFLPVSLLVMFNLDFFNAAVIASDVRKLSPPVQVTTAATSMRLSGSKGRVFLDVKPAPAKIHLYTGKRRLGSLSGKRRTRFDITNYAGKVDKGQLRVVAYDDKGKQTSRTLNVSPYLAKRPARVLSKAQQQQKQTAKDSKHYEMIRPAFDKDKIKDKGEVHASDLDSSSKSIRQFSKSSTLGKTSTQSDRQEKSKVDQSGSIALKQKKLTKQIHSRKKTVSKPGKITLQKPLNSPGMASLKEHKDKVAQLNAKLKKIPAPSVMTATSASGIREATPSELSGTFDARNSGDPDNPSIDEILPLEPQWDSNLTIRGNNFGDVPGYVHVVLKDAQVTIPFQTETWRDRAVTTTIYKSSAGSRLFEQSNAIKSLVERVPGFGTRPMKAVVWVNSIEHRRTKGVLSAGREVTFQVSPLVLVPDINEVVSSSPRRMAIGGGEATLTTDPNRGLPTITPGQTIRLHGRNFLSRPGEVDITIGERKITAEINSWNENELEVTLPSSVEGLVGQVATIFVTNHLGKANRYGAQIYFLPRITWQVLEEVISVDSLGHLECSGRVNLFDYTLHNDWEVDNSFLTVCEAWRPSALLGFDPTPLECSIVAPPRSGSDFARTILNCIAKNGAAVHCGAAIQIRGPAGTNPLALSEPGITRETEVRRLCK